MQPAQNSITVAALLPDGRKAIEEYRVGSQKLWEIRTKLLNDKDLEPNKPMPKFGRAADNLCLAIAGDVAGYDDGSMSRIACRTQLPAFAKMFGMSTEITKDHPLVNLVQEIRDSMHKEKERLLGLPPSEPSIKIDAAAIAQQAKGGKRK